MSCIHSCNFIPYFLSCMQFYISLFCFFPFLFTSNFIYKYSCNLLVCLRFSCLLVWFLLLSLLACLLSFKQHWILLACVLVFLMACIFAFYFVVYGLFRCKHFNNLLVRFLAFLVAHALSNYLLAFLQLACMLSCLLISLSSCLCICVFLLQCIVKEIL